MPMQTSSVDSGMTTPTGKEHPRSSECGQVTAAASSDVVSDEVGRVCGRSWFISYWGQRGDMEVSVSVDV